MEYKDRQKFKEVDQSCVEIVDENTIKITYTILGIFSYTSTYTYTVSKSQPGQIYQTIVTILSTPLATLSFSAKKKHTSSESQPEPIYQKITARLPEDYRSDLFQLRERWQKKGLSPKEIKYLTYKHLIHIIFGLIQVKIENLSLFRYSSNKDN